MNRDAKPESPAAIETDAARWVARRDAGLSPADEGELQRWLDADPRHRTALAFYSATWSSLARPAATGAAGTIDRHLENFAHRRRHRRMIAGGIAAAVLLTAGFLRWNPLDRALRLETSSAVVLSPSTRSLPDGSVVELKENAQIVVEFTPAARRVKLVSGEAHFAVHKDPARPFVVSAADVAVRAVGTAFSVKKSAAAIEVLVTHGNVAVERAPEPSFNAVRPAPTAAPTPLVALDAGKLAVVELAALQVEPDVRTLPAMELSQRLAWRSIRLEFTRTPLTEAITLFNQYAAPDTPRLVIADPEISGRRLSGIFRADNLDAFVLLLEGAFGVKAERTARTISLRRDR